MNWGTYQRNPGGGDPNRQRGLGFKEEKGEGERAGRSAVTVMAAIRRSQIYWVLHALSGMEGSTVTGAGQLMGRRPKRPPPKWAGNPSITKP